jgi:hypothetical protein
MRTSRNGWRARRRYKRERDRVARDNGFENDQACRHEERVRELRRILLKLPIVDGFPMSKSFDSHLFTTYEVAGAIDASPKVVRWLSCTGFMTARKRSTEKARKLFFEAGAVRKYLEACRTGSDHRAFHSEKIAAHPLFANGTAVTKDRAAVTLNLSKRGVEYYLKRGVLKRMVSGSRVTLISRKSLERLAQARIKKADRDFEVARQRLDRADEKRKRLARMDVAPDHVIC